MSKKLGAAQFWLPLEASDHVLLERGDGKLMFGYAIKHPKRPDRVKGEFYRKSEWRAARVRPLPISTEVEKFLQTRRDAIVDAATALLGPKIDKTDESVLSSTVAPFVLKFIGYPLTFPVMQIMTNPSLRKNGRGEVYERRRTDAAPVLQEAQEKDARQLKRDLAHAPGMRELPSQPTANWWKPTAKHSSDDKKEEDHSFAAWNQTYDGRRVEMKKFLKASRAREKKQMAADLKGADRFSHTKKFQELMARRFLSLKQMKTGKPPPAKTVESRLKLLGLASV